MVKVVSDSLSKEQIEDRIIELSASIDNSSTDALKRLSLIQERINYRAMLAKVS